MLHLFMILNIVDKEILKIQNILKKGGNFLMKNFNNSQYEAMVKDFIGDTFYEETSYRGKIATLRSYAEVVVRKLLDLNPNAKMTLGKPIITDKINELKNNKFILDAIKTINADGSNYTHTQMTNEVSKNEFDNMVDKLLDLLSVFLINYFEKYEFGSNEKVMESLSLLPPIIRYKVLIFLYEKYPDNIAIIDKLVLAIQKAFNIAEAITWVEEKKDILIQMSVISKNVFNEIAEKQGLEIAMIIQSSAPPNMFQLCKDKIYQVGNIINANGILYSDFESALPYYKAKGILKGDTPEIIEFNDIMNFLYLGRKENLTELLKDSNSYIVMNCIL